MIARPPPNQTIGATTPMRWKPMEEKMPMNAANQAKAQAGERKRLTFRMEKIIRKGAGGVFGWQQPARGRFIQV